MRISNWHIIAAVLIVAIVLGWIFLISGIHSARERSAVTPPMFQNTDRDRADRAAP
jgi:Na+-transporting NADH:ubiquinone oxidoreductase subunit NqrB